MILPAIAAGVGVAVIVVSANPFIVRAQDAAPETAQSAPQPAAEPPPPDPAAELAAKRDQTRAELETLSKTISLSTDKVSALQQSIADLEKSTESIRQALIDSASRRKVLESRSSKARRSLPISVSRRMASAVPCTSAAACWPRYWQHSSAWAATRRPLCSSPR